MKASTLVPRTLILVFFFCLGNCTDRISKRQIVFEDDANNRVLSSNCRTPDDNPGTCVVLTRCPGLLRSVGSDRIRNYFCGFERNEPKICCPQSASVVSTPGSTRPTPRTVSITNRPPTQQDVRTSASSPTPFTKPDFLPKSCGVRRNKLEIAGGTEAQRGEWPWMAVVFVQNNNGRISPDCGGSLVTSHHVITAAHCVVTGRASRPIDPARLSVRLGGHNLQIDNEPEAVNVRVEDVRVHENFNPRTYRNDIAVLKLSTPVTFTSRIAPVCLPYDSLRGEDLTSKEASIIGYGTIEFNGNSSNVLLKANIDVLSQDMCRRAYEPTVQFTRVYLCAGKLDGSRDACQGDSGGPLLMPNASYRYYLIGVVSFGNGCARPDFPGVYTRITEFLDWLTRNLSD